MTYNFLVINSANEHANKIVVSKKLIVSEDTNKHVIHRVLKDERSTERDAIRVLQTVLDQAGVHFDLENNRGETILHLAIGRRMKDFVEVLIMNGDNIHKIDEHGNNVTHYFIEDEYSKFLDVPQLYKECTEVWKSRNIETDSAKFAEWMLMKGFDFTRKNNEGDCALSLAIKYNLYHIIPTLLHYIDNVKSIDYNHRTLLHLFLDSYFIYKMFFRLINPIWWSSYTSRYTANIIETLLFKGIHIMAKDINGITPIMIAFDYVNDTIVNETLVNHVLNHCYDREFVTILFHDTIRTCGKWFSSQTEYLLGFLERLEAIGANVNAKDENGIAPVNYAVRGGNLRVVYFLNELQADFKTLTDSKVNLVHEFAQSRSWREEESFERMWNLLVHEKGCDVHAVDAWGRTPLHVAAENSNVRVARKLIKHGVDIDSRDDYMQTPLQYALVMKDPLLEMVELLLDNGADVNVKNINGDTPMLVAADAGESPTKVNVIKTLLKYGALVNSRNRQGLSSLFNAILSQSIASIKILLKYGENPTEPCVLQLLLVTNNPTEKFMLRYLLKLQALNWKECTTFIMHYERYGKFDLKWLMEIHSMQQILINHRTSLHDFLRMDRFRKCFYTTNDRLLNVVYSPELGCDFPEYAIVIWNSYCQAVERKPLLVPAKRALVELTRIKWPEICIQKIFIYLTNADLWCLIEKDRDYF